MIKIGYHISQEQYPPSELLNHAKMAEEAGFQFAMSSDHFHTWNSNQGHSGYTWSWLGAAMCKTDLSYGVVTCPSFRYHPAIIAQAAATLDEMFPGKFWMAVGSGQALNEAITGEHWPAKSERNERLKEAVDIIRSLWNGETVTRRGLIKVEEATLHTRPTSDIPIVGAAITPATAAWLSHWADGLITISQPMEKLKEVVDQWKSNGGEKKPMILKAQISYDKNMGDAMEGAYEQWRTNIFGSDMLAELRNPMQFEQAAMHVKPEELQGHVNISNDLGQHMEWLEKYIEMGFNEIVLHNVNKKQEQFIDVFGSKVLTGIGVSS
jgi:coenzyme F420-dependent glucose-6-phosphate dehydrogenase